MFKEMKESINLEKQLKKQHICRYNNKLYNIQYKKLRFIILIVTCVLIVIFSNIIADKFIKEYINYEDKVDIVYSSNSFFNSIIELIVSIGISVITLVVIDLLSKAFWKLICAIKGARYSDDFIIYDLKCKMGKDKPLSKYDYIFGNIFSAVLVGLCVVLINSYIKYNFLGDIYFIVFAYIVISMYLLFQKCEYILPSLSGYIYLNERED